MLSDLWLILFLSSWVVFFFFYQRKRKIFDAGSLVYIFYILIAFLSWRLYDTSIWRYVSLHFFPFMYLFIMMYISSMTIFRYDITKVNTIRQPDMKLFTIVALFYIVPMLISFPNTISHLREGLVELITEDMGASMYKDTMNSVSETGKGITNIRAIFTGAFSVLGILLTFYYYTLPERKKWLSISLVLTMIVEFLQSASGGGRTSLTQLTITMIGSYFMFRKFYDNKIRRVFRIVGIAVLSVFSILFLSITISRFGGMNEGGFESMIYYSGQSNLYFAGYALDDGGIRYGDRTIPLFKRMLGFQNVPSNYLERRAKYPNLYINDEVFCTHIGDFTIDFGPVVAFVLFVAFTIVFLKKTRIHNNEIDFSQLILIHFVLYLCLCGSFTLYPYADVGGNLKVIVAFIAYYVFKYTNHIIEKK